MTHLGLLRRIEYPHTVIYHMTTEGYTELERMRKER